jgi:DNA-binding NarL/FixJ family response regulator
MKICLLNEQAERREGLKALLRQLDRQAKFHDARDWWQAERALQRSKPDMLVVDWQDGMRSQDIFTVRRNHPIIPIAVLVDDDDPTLVAAMIHAGVLGVVPRQLHPRLIVRAFEIVLLGGHYVPAAALNVPIPSVVPFNAHQGDAFARELPRHARAAPTLLSPRQEQIMRFVHMGNTNKVIARTLGISEGTVKIHLASIFRKLGATNRAAAVAIYNGWQSDALEVLKTAAQSAPRPVLGETGPTPLRPGREYRRRDAANEREQAAALKVAEPGPVWDESYGAPYKTAPRKRR